MSESLLSISGVLHVDHIAVTTASLERTLTNYLALPNSKLLKGPSENHTQRVRYAFVGLAPGLTIEILSPMANSPITSHVARGGGAYHICFAVSDIRTAITSAIGAGARVVTEPQADPAFEGRPVAFLFHELHGIFEFVELAAEHPRDMPGARSWNGLESSIRVESRISSNNSVNAESSTEARLLSIFRRAFPTRDPTLLPNEEYSSDGEWDSLMHLQLMGELEIEFGISIPSSDVGSLTSFSKLLSYIDKVVKAQE